MIEELGNAARINLLKSVFACAIRNKDDEHAKETIEFFRSAFLDPTVVPLLSSRSGGVTVLYETPQKKEMIKPVQAELAKALMELYATIPFYKDMMLGPVFLETKRIMLSEIAKSWREADDEKWAEEIVLFFAALEMSHHFTKEKEMVLSVVRDCLREGFSPSRLTTHFLSVSKSGMKLLFRSEIEQAIVIACVRRKLRSPYSKMVSEMEIMQRLDGCSSGAFDYVAKIAQETAALDAEIRKLFEEIRKHNYLYYGVNISYNGMDHIRIDAFIRDNASEKEMKVFFEKVSLEIKAWKKAAEGRSSCRVTLNAVITSSSHAAMKNEVLDTFRSDTI
jgi:hypothetical protein